MAVFLYRQLLIRILKVTEHCIGSGGSVGSGYSEMSPDTILPPPPKQTNFTTTASACGDLKTIFVHFQVLQIIKIKNFINYYLQNNCEFCI